MGRKDRIRIFVTNLSQYVAGCLVGEYVELPIPWDKFQEVLNRIGIDEQHGQRGIGVVLYHSSLSQNRCLV